jgi:OOP family OmpA-OmpF porin
MLELDILRKKTCHAKDRMGNLMAGITGQIKLSNRVALTGDFNNFTEDKILLLMVQVQKAPNGLSGTLSMVQ